MESNPSFLPRSLARVVSLALAMSLVLLLPASDAAATPDPVPAVTVRKPVDCVARKPRRDRRILYDCAREERLHVFLDGRDPAPLDPVDQPVTVPSELLHVFRWCPFEPVLMLDAAPALFLTYEDRDVGRCYLYAPLDRDALAGLGAFDRRKHLQTLHPFLAAAMARAIADAAACGHRFRVISGTRAGGVKASWHTFGLAVDVNLRHRKGLREATAAYLAGGDERDAWLALAAAAEKLGLYWLGRRDPDEIFHFEWRPGWPGLPRDDLARELRAAAAEGGLPGVWARLAYDPTRPTAMRALREPLPD